MSTRMKQRRYWHFLPDDKRLRYGNGKLVRTGMTVRYDGEPVPCQAGLHASYRAIDALKYAPGAVICRVTLGGKVVECDAHDKLAAQSRTVLWMADATQALHRFACRVATDALKAARVTEKACFEAIRVKLLWLDGKSTHDELYAASNAAENANAAWSAAWSAAENAAASAAASAAESAAENAAESAARSAAWSAAESAAWRAARRAAWSVAESAAWRTAASAATSAQNRVLESMLLKLHPE